MSLILVTLTPRSDSDFERSHISVKENKLDGVDLNTNCLTVAFDRTKEKLYGFRQTVLVEFFKVKSLEKYFVFIICRNCVDSMETVWRVIRFMEILW